MKEKEWKKSFGGVFLGGFGKGGRGGGRVDALGNSFFRVFLGIWVFFSFWGVFKTLPPFFRRGGKVRDGDGGFGLKWSGGVWAPFFL